MPVRIFWVTIFAFLAGVFIRSYVTCGEGFVLFLALSGVAVSFVARRNSVLIAVALVTSALGVAHMGMGIIPGEPTLDARIGLRTTLEGVVSAEPDARDTGVRVSLHTSSIGSSTAPVRAGVLVIVPPRTSVAFGDTVRVSGTLRTPEAFDGSGGRSFDYPAYLAKDGILYELAFAHIDARAPYAGVSPVFWFEYGSIWLKQRFQDGLGQALPEPHAGLAGGITVGDKRGVGKEWSNKFRTASLTHIIVLSGYNIMIVMYVLARVLAKARVRRGVQYATSVLVAGIFMAMTGFAAAATRAALMALIAIMGEATGRRYMAGRALGIVAFGMVAWNPYSLAFDPGFQLSILATIGMLAVSPIVARHLAWVSESWGLRDALATTIGTQLTVLPLLLYQTGNLSLVALPANIVALSAVPYAMGFSVAAGIAGLMLGPIAPVIALPAYILLSYILGVAEFFAQLPYASVVVPLFSGWWLMPVYAALGWWVVSQKAGPAREIAPAPRS